MFYNSLDLDGIDKHKLDEITSKISRKKCCLAIEVKDSSTKGYHILITCKEKCDICRMVFDDQKRLEMDSRRDLKYQNTVFQSKEYIDKKEFNPTCDRCAQFNRISYLQRKELSYPETLVKLETGKVKLPKFLVGLLSGKTVTQAVYFGYIYFECPICNWFKFVKTEKVEKNENKF